MITPQERAWLDQQDTHVAQTIRKFGLHLTYVSGGQAGVPPAFAYTTGLFGCGHPELVVLSLNPQTAARLLNDLGGLIREGTDLVPGEVRAFEQWGHRVTVEELPNPGEILFSANRHYQRPDEFSVPAYQLTYDDLGGRFPTEEGYSNPPNLQPRPGTWRA
jgi:hypothetical protein